MVDYTQSELGYIRKNRKKSEEKPAYYNSATDQTNIISDEFEAYLILQKVAAKQKILQRLRKNIKDNSDYTDRDAILQDLISNINKDVELKLTELDKETENFSEFKQSILDEDRRFDDLNELNRLITVINTSIEELTFQRDQAFQDGNVSLILDERLQLAKSDEKTKKEYDVWQKVISAYQGTR